MSYYLIHTTYLIIFVAVFARQLCLPVPSLLFLLSAGALAGSGKLSYGGILAVAALGCVLADLVWFEAGRLYGKRVLRLLCVFAPDPSHCIRKARGLLTGRGLKILFVAKFVPGLDAICPPLAGMSETKRRDFIIHDSVGAMLWAATYISLGYVFARELDRVSVYIAKFSDTLVFVLAPPLLILVVWKLLASMRQIRLLRSRQITAEVLSVRMNSGEKLGVIDLLRFEEDPDHEAGIPGAIRLDPSELRRKSKVVIPAGLDVILYCRSKNSFASARVAAAMRRRGIDNICVLQGGLAAWKSMGFPVSGAFAEPKEVFERLGIIVGPPLNSSRRAPSIH